MSTVKGIVKDWLIAHGYDGLYSENGQCGCDLDDLMVCDAAGIDLCKPGYKVDDPSGEFEYRIVPEKPTRPFKFEPSSDMAIPPGEYLKEVMEARNLTVDDMQRAGIYPNQLQKVLAGDAEITERLALYLQNATGVPGNIWLGLDREYQRAVSDGQKGGSAAGGA